MQAAYTIYIDSASVQDGRLSEEEFLLACKRAYEEATISVIPVVQYSGFTKQEEDIYGV